MFNIYDTQLDKFKYEGLTSRKGALVLGAEMVLNYNEEDASSDPSLLIDKDEHTLEEIIELYSFEILKTPLHQYFRKNNFTFIMEIETQKHIHYEGGGIIDDSYKEEYNYGLIGHGEVDGHTIEILDGRFVDEEAFFEEVEKYYNQSEDEEQFLDYLLTNGLYTLA